MTSLPHGASRNASGIYTFDGGMAVPLALTPDTAKFWRIIRSNAALRSIAIPVVPYEKWPAEPLMVLTEGEGRLQAWQHLRWADFNLTQSMCNELSRKGASVGLRCGHEIKGKPYTVAALDVDIDHDTLARRVVEMAPPGAVVRSRPDSYKVLLIYAAEVPIASRSIGWSWEGLAPKAEVIGKGRQFVLAGMHPDGCYYETTWNFDLDSLVAITEAQVQAWLNDVHNLMAAHGATDALGRKLSIEAADLETDMKQASTEELEHAVITGEHYHPAFLQLSYRYLIDEFGTDPDQDDEHAFALVNRRLEALILRVPKTTRADHQSRYNARLASVRSGSYTKDMAKGGRVAYMGEIARKKGQDAYAKQIVKGKDMGELRSIVEAHLGKKGVGASEKGVSASRVVVSENGKPALDNGKEVVELADGLEVSEPDRALPYRDWAYSRHMPHQSLVRELYEHHLATQFVTPNPAIAFASMRSGLFGWLAGDAVSEDQQTTCTLITHLLGGTGSGKNAYLNGMSAMFRKTRFPQIAHYSIGRQKSAPAFVHTMQIVRKAIQVLDEEEGIRAGMTDTGRRGDYGIKAKRTELATRFGGHVDSESSADNLDLRSVYRPILSAALVSNVADVFKSERDIDSGALNRETIVFTGRGVVRGRIPERRVDDLPQLFLDWIEKVRVVPPEQAWFERYQAQTGRIVHRFENGVNGYVNLDDVTAGGITVSINSKLQQRMIDREYDLKTDDSVFKAVANFGRFREMVTRHVIGFAASAAVEERGPFARDIHPALLSMLPSTEVKVDADEGLVDLCMEIVEAETRLMASIIVPAENSLHEHAKWAARKVERLLSGELRPVTRTASKYLKYNMIPACEVIRLLNRRKGLSRRDVEDVLALVGDNCKGNIALRDVQTLSGGSTIRVFVALDSPPEY